MEDSNPETILITPLKLRQDYDLADWSQTSNEEAFSRLETALLDFDGITRKYRMGCAFVLLGNTVWKGILPKCREEDMLAIGQINRAISSVLKRPNTTAEQAQLIAEIQGKIILQGRLFRNREQFTQRVIANEKVVTDAK